MAKVMFDAGWARQCYDRVVSEAEEKYPAFFESVENIIVTAISSDYASSVYVRVEELGETPVFDIDNTRSSEKARRLLVAVFKKRGYDVEIVTNGDENVTVRTDYYVHISWEK